MSILEKTEVYRLYKLPNTFLFSFGLEFKQDAIKFNFIKLSLDGLTRNNSIHRARLEKRSYI